MKNILLVLLSLVMIVSCSNSEVPTTSEGILYRLYGEAPTVSKTAEVRTVNGVVIKVEKMPVVRDGLHYEHFSRTLANGTYEIYYDNGQLRGRRTYKDGKRDGLYEAYFDDGKLRNRGTAKDGKRDGLYESYKSDGTLIEKCFYVNGKKYECE